MTRGLLVILAIASLTVSPGCTGDDGAPRAPSFASDWQSAADGVWVGPEYWANPLEDWRVQDGRLENDTNPLAEGWVGFRLGIRGAIDDYRDSAVLGVGLDVRTLPSRPRWLTGGPRVELRAATGDPGP